MKLAFTTGGVGPMPEAAHEVDHEFWRPPVQGVQVQDVRIHPESCPRCGTEFVLGSRFCHVCGTERDARPEHGGGSIARFLDFQIICNAMGLGVGSLIGFIVGIVCVIAAVTTGFLYTATTLLDWQAVQIWRIEWLLAAAVAFMVGILLKRSET